ncbi:membrane protein [Streptomyces cinereoruber]|uniref:Membrane protein n=3 Tax=Streptomyces TaxID=1883 RepID=A0AAV4KIK4_9ACTN|nr:membrane protein [Streptomyces cinereoruber]
MNMRTRHTATGAMAAVTVLLCAGTAAADETHLHSHNGPNVSLVSTGQIDDPLEDVLEHAAILGGTYSGDTA